MQLTMEGRIFRVKSYYETKKLQSSSNQAQDIVSIMLTSKYNHNLKKMLKI